MARENRWSLSVSHVCESPEGNPLPSPPDGISIYAIRIHHGDTELTETNRETARLSLRPSIHRVQFRKLWLPACMGPTGTTRASRCQSPGAAVQSACLTSTDACLSCAGAESELT